VLVADHTLCSASQSAVTEIAGISAMLISTAPCVIAIIKAELIFHGAANALSLSVGG
jgi:hypothetical protein